VRKEAPRVQWRVMFCTTSTLVPHLRRTSVTARVRSPTNDRRWRRHERCRHSLSNDLLLLGSGDTAYPLADPARAVISATNGDDDTETDERPGSPPSVCAHAPARRGSKLPAPPTTGKPNVWLSRLLSAPSLPSTSEVSPRCMAPVAGGELGICPRTSSMLDRDAPPIP